MSSRFDFDGSIPFVVVSIVAVLLTVWQVQVDRTVYARFLGVIDPVGAMVVTAVGGVVVIAWLQAASDFAVSGPGTARDAISIMAWAVPSFAAVAIGADLVIRFDEDMNVALPDALRFYPAIAVVVETVLHALPIAVLVAVFGMPTAIDASFWRIAIPVALIEAILQAVAATSTGTAVFSAVHVLAFGVVQVWMFWRFGFVWMLGFRLAYYALWHVGWGAIRLQLLF